MIYDLEIKKMTEALREGDEPLWRRLRVLLEEKGIDGCRSAMAYLAAEEPFYDFGIIVAQNGEVYEFALDYLNKDIRRGVFAEWSNVSGEVGKKPYREQVALARRLVEKLQDE